MARRDTCYHTSLVLALGTIVTRLPGRVPFSREGSSNLTNVTLRRKQRCGVELARVGLALLVRYQFR